MANSTVRDRFKETPEAVIENGFSSNSKRRRKRKIQSGQTLTLRRRAVHL